MNLIAYKFNERPVRFTEIVGVPHCVGIDVARCLEYKRTADAIRRHCKGSVKCRLPSDGGEQDFVVIPEADVYRLILRSKTPNAEAFQDWIVEEVLPAIRKTGSYAAPAKRMPTSTELAMMVIARDKQETISREMMDIIEPDYSKYGEPGRSGDPRVKVRRAAFVSGKGRLAHAATLLTLHGQLDLQLNNG